MRQQLNTSVIGVLLVAGIPLDEIIAEMSDLLKRPKLFSGGNCSLIEIVQQSLGRVLPQDAHKNCTDKLGLSVTKLSWSLENKFIHQFESRQELIQAVVAGCYIPIWAGLSVPKFRGQKCLDGAYSDNTPKFELKNGEQIRQVELCPFSSEIEVSPPDKCRIFMCKIMGTRYYVNWKNSLRTKQAVIPWNPASYRQLLSDGHRDMKEFVFKNNLVKCRDCYLKISAARRRQQQQQQTEVKADRITKDSSCLACLKLLEKVDSLRVPEAMFRIMK